MINNRPVKDRTLRWVVIKIDDLVRMLEDYLPEEDVQGGLRPVKIQVHPQDKNKIGIVVENDKWNGFMGEQLVDIDIKRFYGVGSERG